MELKGEIANPSLADKGQLKIDWAKRNMPILSVIRERFIKEKPLKDIRVALSVHMEAKTACLCKLLADGGAEMYATGCNPLSTQDDVAAALSRDMTVFAVHGADEKTYERHIDSVVSAKPHIIIDDGGDIVKSVLLRHTDIIDNIIGGCEETTTGIKRLEVLDREGKLPFPMVLVNNAKSKYLFDNRYGTGQSVWNGINRTTNLIVAGKTVVVAGYGWCGKGIALRAKGLGASVIVTEIDPIAAVEAVMDGFKVMKMSQAAPLGDIFVTATGCKDVITKEHFENLKEGAILCNAGHFDVEVDVKGLAEIADSSYTARDNIVGYKLKNGKTVFVLAQGRLVNLAAGDGHPAEIMDMSFAIQALSAEYLVKNRDKITKKLIAVPKEIDSMVSALKLSFMGAGLDSLTKEQKIYLGGKENL